MNSPHLIAKAEIERRKRWKAKQLRADASCLRDLFGIDTGIPIFTDAELKAYFIELNERIAVAARIDMAARKEIDDWNKLDHDGQAEQALRAIQSDFGTYWVRFRGRRARLKSLSFPELCELVNENGDFLQRTRFVGMSKEVFDGNGTQNHA